MCSHLIVNESIFAIAPRGKGERCSRISADRRVRPTWRHHDNIPRFSHHREASAGVICRKLLHVDDPPASPNLIDFRRRPTAVSGYTVYMTLTADGLVPEPSGSVGDNSKQQLALFEFLLVLALPHVHHDGIDGIGTVAGRIVETLADRIEAAVLRRRPEYIGAELKSHGVFGNANVESRVETHGFVLTYALIVACRPSRVGRIV